MKRCEKGFTLIELILVIAIIGISAAMALPKFFDAKARAEEVVIKQVEAHIETTILALQTRYVLTGQNYEAQDIVDNLNLQGMTIVIEDL